LLVLYTKLLIATIKSLLAWINCISILRKKGNARFIQATGKMQCKKIHFFANTP
jgi:hypothetical protein